MLKGIAMGLTSVLGISLAGFFQGPEPRPGYAPPPPKAKGKKGAPGDELRKTYDLLRRVRSDAAGGRTEERLSDWIERASSLYRQAVRLSVQGELRRARELGTAAHDLARAVDHARNATQLDRPDPDLPPPPDGIGPEDVGERARRDLYRAYEHIQFASAESTDAESRFYLNAARDLYNAARRDAEANREERSGELARAAEAMTHVPEHLRNAAEGSEGTRTRDGFDPAPAEPKKKDRAKVPGVFDAPPAAQGERPGAATAVCRRHCLDRQTETSHAPSASWSKCPPWTCEIESDSTDPIFWAWRRSASRCPTCRFT